MPRRTYFVLALVAIVMLAGCAKRYVKLTQSEVKDTEIAHATQIANDLILKMQASQFYPLGDEATARMRHSFTPGEQVIAWKQILDLYGDFQGMEYVHTWASRDGLNMRIYRFRGDFSKGARPEVRVVMDNDGLLAGLWIKDWKEGVE
ncbi:MAG: DUF3887 domain-containing protein [Candidatus Cloacimonetes bacterium]|nr:DUF3887 domain-containing protein [Candidatus Cloacimonadota bacterium]